MAVAIFFAYIVGFFAKIPNSVKAQGDIVSIKQISCDRGMYKPTIRYVVDNKEYCITAGYSGRNYYVGQKMTVRYNKKNPEEAVVRPETSTCVALGLVFVVGLYIAIATFFPELGLGSAIGF